MPRVTKNKVMAAATSTMNAVKCVVCGKIHPVETQDYVAFYGDVIVGSDTPIVGGNIDDRGKVIGSRVYCRDRKCLEGLMEFIIQEPPEIDPELVVEEK